MNFDRTAHLFPPCSTREFFAVVLLDTLVLGHDRLKRREDNMAAHRHGTHAAGFVFVFSEWVADSFAAPLTATMLALRRSDDAAGAMSADGGLWASRLLKNNLMDDVFNNENESFQQETRPDQRTLCKSAHASTIAKRWNRGWINVVNPFRAAIVYSGTPRAAESPMPWLLLYQATDRKGCRCILRLPSFPTFRPLPTTIC